MLMVGCLRQVFVGAAHGANWCRVVRTLFVAVARRIAIGAGERRCGWVRVLWQSTCHEFEWVTSVVELSRLRRVRMSIVSRNRDLGSAVVDIGTSCLLGTGHSPGYGRTSVLVIVCEKSAPASTSRTRWTRARQAARIQARSSDVRGPG